MRETSPLLMAYMQASVLQPLQLNTTIPRPRRLSTPKLRNDHPSMDLLDHMQMKRTVSNKLGEVVNAVADVDVEGSEVENEVDIGVTGVKEVASAVAEVGVSSTRLISPCLLMLIFLFRWKRKTSSRRRGWSFQLARGT